MKWLAIFIFGMIMGALTLAMICAIVAASEAEEREERWRK